MVAEAISGGHGLPELDPGAVKGHDRIPRVTDAAPHVRRHHFVIHLQRGEEDVSISIHLCKAAKDTKIQRGLKCQGAAPLIPLKLILMLNPPSHPTSCQA